MAELQHIEIRLEEFAQDKFVDWIVENQYDEQSGMLDDLLDDLVNLPYVEFAEKHEDRFLRFIMSVVDSKKPLDQNKIEGVSVKEGEIIWCDNQTFAKELALAFLRFLREEYGISGHVPPPFTTFIISSLREGIGNLKEYLREESSDKPISSRSIREACLVCRAVESMVNIFVELFYYILHKLPKDTKSWFKKVEFMRSARIHKHRHLTELESVLKGDSESKGVLDVFQEIREIRNKVAHPKGLTREDLRNLIELSEHLMSHIKAFVPLQARIISIETNLSRVLRVRLYAESDKERSEPHIFVIRHKYPLLSVRRIERSVGRECIVFPCKLVGDQYIIDPHPLLLPREDKIIEKLHSNVSIEHKILIFYSEILPDKPIGTYTLEY
mgnify:CR=1 FL=1